MNATATDGRLSNLMEAAAALATLTGQQQQQQSVTGTVPGVAVVPTATMEASPASSAFAPHLISAESTTTTKPTATAAKKTQSKVVTAAVAPNSNKEIFPERLMAILNDDSLTDVITFLPHGRSFVIIRPDVLCSEVLPKYLPPVDSRSANPKYPSFTRKLNRWGFRQATRGPDTGAFHHPLFRRDQPDLRLNMVCQRGSRGGSGRDTKKKGSALMGNKKGRGSLPAKKRHLAQLTKESLDMMNSSSNRSTQTPTTTMAATTTSTTTITATPKPATVSESSSSSSDADSQSSKNNGGGHGPAASTLVGTPQQQQPHNNNNNVAATLFPLTTTAIGSGNGITSDPVLTQRAVAQRNEEERLRVAKAMLYHAYLQAIQPSAAAARQHGGGASASGD